ncbi:hypothetical protein C8R44DRAFT_785303 [Mycena epipterygia]|nr:hypothetical protein C8R44DRAFT_785303 [Mycena epipterygia]
MQRVRDRLAELDAQISILEAERKLLRKKLRTIRYPVLTLPPEITAEIFVHCLPVFPKLANVMRTPDPQKPHPHDSPLLLLTICRAWREIALKTPRLWASLSCHIGGAYPSLLFEGELGRRRFSDWIQRAGSTPLHLHLQYSSSDPSTPSTSTEPGLDIFFQVLERAPQWCDVDLEILAQDLLQERVETALHRNLPALETLALDVRNAWGPPRAGPVVPITAFARAPKLRAVCLGGLALSNIILPWAQLTSFTAVTRLSVNDCGRLLQLAPHLASFNLHSVYGQLANLTLLPALPHLKALVLESHTCAQILQVLTLPGLIKLDLPRFLPAQDKHLIPFLTRSSPPGLREISLRGSYDSFTHGLRFMPVLTKIEIDDMAAARVAGILEFLLKSASSLAHLESISIRIIDTEDDKRDMYMDYDVVVNTIERLKDNALKSFSLTWILRNEEYLDRSSRSAEENIGVRPTFDVLQQLADLRDEGVRVYLGTTMQAWI